MSPFRKRSALVFCSVALCRDVVVSEDGKRNFSLMSDQTYLDKYPPATEEYSLTEELAAGVPLKEIPCSNLIGSNDPIDHPIDESKVNETIQSMLNPQES